MTGVQTCALPILRRLRAELWRSARAGGDGSALRATFAAGVRAASACLRDPALRDAAVLCEGSARAFADAIAALRPSDSGASAYVAAVDAEANAAITATRHIAAAAAIAAGEVAPAEASAVNSAASPGADVLALHAERVEDAAAALARFDLGVEADACLAAAAALLRAIAAEREAIACLGAALSATPASVIASGLQAEADADAGA